MPFHSGTIKSSKEHVRIPKETWKAMKAQKDAARKKNVVAASFTTDPKTNQPVWKRFIKSLTAFFRFSINPTPVEIIEQPFIVSTKPEKFTQIGNARLELHKKNQQLNRMKSITKAAPTKK